MEPTLGGFVSFVTNVMQTPGYFDAMNSPYVAYAYDMAAQWVARELCVVPSLPSVWNMYALAIYNFGADRLINFAQDAPDDPPVPNSGSAQNPAGLQYWAWLRSQYGVLAFQPGVIQSTSDEGTSAAYVVPEQFKRFSVADLSNLKTPYGRQYLGIAQSFGTVWGLS